MTKRQLNKYRRQFKKMSFNQKLSLFAGIFTLTLLVLLAVSSIFLQKRLREEEFDVRKEAWVEQGTVSINTVPAPGTTFQIGEEATIDIVLNTGSTFIDGLQLNFGIDSDDNGILTNTETNLTTMDINGLDFHVAEIIYPFCGDEVCYSAELLATTTLDNIEDGYTTHGNDVIIARFIFTPQIAGEFQFTFNGSEYVDRSYAIDSADHETDQLQRVSNFHYYVELPIYECTDTDGGRIFEEFGTVSGFGNISVDNACPSGNCDDFCFVGWSHTVPDAPTPVDEGENINEWFCNEENRISYERRACSDFDRDGDHYTCQNGQCVNETPQTCDAPYSFQVDSTSCSASGDNVTVNLNWSPIFGATQYEVQISQDPSFSTDVHTIDWVGETQLTRSDLTPGTWYARVKVSEALSDTCSVIDDNWTTNVEFTQDCDEVVLNPINWRTDHAWLAADHFYIEANGERYYSTDIDFTLHSDPPFPPTDDYTTLEASWTENGVEMRYYIYFNRNEDHWWTTEMRTYDGEDPGDWITYIRDINYFEGPLGQAYTPLGDVVFTSNDGSGSIHFVNLRVQAFNQVTTCGNGTCEGWENANNCPQDCSTQTPQCTYDCSWGSCVNDWQTLSCTANNEPCEDYDSSNQNGRIEYCGTAPVDPNLYLYNYEACWYNNSSGETTYIIWDNEAFSNVSWIDVSTHADFREFAHKNVENDTDAHYENYVVTNGTGFTWSNDNRQFTFAPGTWYYFRLFNGVHSRVAAFYMPRCAGTGDPGYQYCNESCNNNSDCASNLSCYQGSCRLPSNPESDVCAPLPGGINRTCDEYCADTTECAEGYSCWWNRCRHPENLEDTQCREPETPETGTGGTTYVYTYPGTAPYTYEIKSCNEYCTSNAHCENNHRCYNNSCRLAINPESEICDPYDIVDTKGKKGDKEIDEATEEAIVEEEEDDDDEEAITPAITHEPIDTGIEDDEVPPDQTALDALKQYLEDRGLSLTTLAVAFGGGLLLLIILLVFLGKKASEGDNNHPRTPPPSAMMKKPTMMGKPPITKPGAPIKKQGIITPPPSSMLNKLNKKSIQKPGQK